jgi:restriction endonuclease S subunit
MRGIGEIQKRLKEIEKEEAQLRKELSQLEREKRKSRSDSYKKKKELLTKSAPLFMEILEVGDVVEVTGSRAGKYRRVVKIQNGPYGGRIWGYVIYQKRSKVDGKWVLKFVEDTTKITDHMATKILAVKKEDGWITAKEIVDKSLDSD